VSRTTAAGIVRGGAFAAIGIAFPFIIHAAWIVNIGVLTLMYAALATAWNLFSGYTGYISLGQVAFFGLGAYTLAITFEHFGIGSGYNPFWALPLVGAGIYAAAGGGVVAILDSFSFVAVVGSLLLMRTPEPRFERVEHTFIHEAMAGARHIIHTVPLRQIVFSTGAALLAVGFSETIIFAVIDQGLHRAPSFLGVLSTLQGVGAIAGGVTAARLLRRVGDVRVAGLGWRHSPSATAASSRRACH